MVRKAWGCRVALVATMMLRCLVGAASAVTPTTSGGGFLSYDDVKGEPYDVQFDGRSFYLSGERTLFLSGSVHPARIPVGEWHRTLRTLKSNGLNMVQIYVFWNVHEPDAPGATDWGVVNLDDFVRLAADLGLFVNLRVGPYVCAEWKFGGLPLWLFNRTAYPTLTLRTDDPVWMDLMGDWFQRVVDSLAHHFAPLGGPIAAVQVENELAYDAPRIRPMGGSTRGDRRRRRRRRGARRPPRKHPTPVAVPVLMCEGSVAPNAVAACNGPTCADLLEDPVVARRHRRGDGRRRRLQARVGGFPGGVDRDGGWVSNLGRIPGPSHGVFLGSRRGRRGARDVGVVRARGRARQLLHVRRRE